MKFETLVMKIWVIAVIFMPLITEAAPTHLGNAGL